MGDPVPVGDRDEVGVRMSQHLDSITAIYVGSQETVPQEYELDPIRDHGPMTTSTDLILRRNCFEVSQSPRNSPDGR